MGEVHPNLALLRRLDPANMTNSDIFADDVVFHYFNPRLPELQGSYEGMAGIESFFAKIAELSHGTFKVSPVSATAMGDELVVTQTRNTMTVRGEEVEIDVVVVWRLLEGRVAEVWDIPSVYVAASDRVRRPAADDSDGIGH